MTLGIDVLDRQQIVGSAREHSRSEWIPGGDFADARNVSVGSNTVFVFDKSEKTLRTLALGSCDPALGYTGPLRNPPGIRSGDAGCGYAYGNDWWDSASAGRTSAILNLDHPLGENAEFRLDAQRIREEIAAGRYDLADPLSTDPDHLEAIDRSSLRENNDAGARYLGARFALEGRFPALGGCRTTLKLAIW